ncbi:MAG TPA: hypothetical protein PL048_04925 [Leptospiraceae bacterium]|nr:hypothetical protein [Leptospiraceae bacterium]HMY65183.1 hypothetical protein [Leptospiraceae bacterium]HMZ58092.1 hypothetical protein [Leptospiraceae bacterium]HNF14673.1 hypothetical protein [Leptospiraceae bacterium]HNF24776.1 hypothetical protein [Leptospiraceae bacterium]
MQEEHISKKTETQRLHVLLGGADGLDFLERLSPHELFALRNKFSAAMQNEHAATWEKLAGVAKFMPNFLNARVSQDILGPSITASLTYFIPVSEAISISSHFNVSFMCDVIEHLNPAKLEPLIRDFPVDRIKKIIHEFEKRKGWYTMGNFVDYMPAEKVIMISKEINSDETLIRTGSFSNEKERLIPVIRAFSDDRIRSLLQTGSSLGLCDDVLAIIKYIPFEELKKYIGILVGIGGKVFQDYLGAAKKMGGEELDLVKKVTVDLGLTLDWN